MAVVAAVAAALAFGAAMATGAPFGFGEFIVAPAWYGLALLPAVVAVARGRRPVVPPLAIPPKPARILKIACAALVLLLISAERLPAGAATGVVAVAANGVVALSFWWPHPAFVRASVALSAVLLARPRADPLENPPALALMVAAAAVALVAANRLTTAAEPVLGGVRAPARPRRVGAEAAFVVLAVLLGVAVASLMDDPQPQASESRTGDEAQPQQPAPLAFQDVLDPSEAAASGRGDPDEVLLRVDTDRAGVLRAITFDEWDGRRWRRSARLDPDAPFDSRGGVPVGGDGLGGFTGTFNRQRITVEAPYAGVAVGTPQVFFYDLPVAGFPYLDGTVELVPALGKGAVYVAQTGQRDVTAAELRASTAGLVPERLTVSGSVGSFTVGPQLSPTLSAAPPLSERARALAERVTAGAGSDYDKVAALTAYLDTAVEVDTDAAAIPAGTDYVDSVVFGDGPSSPERLATTLALLTRAVGLPARLATGFLPGQRPFFGGDFVVRAGDAHAWVEVPFAGLAWQRFDPSGRIARAEQQDSLWSRFKRVLERYWFVFVLVIVALGVLVARRVLARRRLLAATPWATRYFARLTRLGAKRGRPRRPAETPAEYTTALVNTVLADERLVEVGRVVTAAAWSGRQPPDTTRAWAEQVLQEAARATRARRARRAFAGSAPDRPS